MPAKNKISLQPRPSSADNPLSIYLQTLAPSGRRSIQSLLKTAINQLDPLATLDRFDWCSLGYQDLVKIRFKLLNNGASRHTVNTTLSALRSVIKTAFNMGLIEADSMLRASAIKPVKGQSLPSGRSLSPAEISQLLRTARLGKRLVDQRNHSLLYLLLTTGLRRDELVHLQLRDFDTQSNLLEVRTAKGRQQRQLPVPRRCASRLKQWINRLDDNGPLFCRILKGDRLTQQKLSTQAVYSIITQLAAQAGIPHCTPHDLRRTFITRQLAAGHDIGQVSRLAGHQDIKTTLIYDRRY